MPRAGPTPPWLFCFWGHGPGGSWPQVFSGTSWRKGDDDGPGTDLRHHPARRRAIARRHHERGGEARDRAPDGAPGGGRERGRIRRLHRGRNRVRPASARGYWLTTGTLLG